MDEKVEKVKLEYVDGINNFIDSFSDNVKPIDKENFITLWNNTAEKYPLLQDLWTSHGD